MGFLLISEYNTNHLEPLKVAENTRKKKREENNRERKRGKEMVHCSSSFCSHKQESKMGFLLISQYIQNHLSLKRSKKHKRIEREREEKKWFILLLLPLLYHSMKEE